MSVEINVAHDRDELELSHADGIERLSKVDANKIIYQLQEGLKEIAARKGPPCPRPWNFDDADKRDPPFAEAYNCSGSKAGKMLCAGGVGGNEFYLEHFVSLHRWIGQVLDYHRKNNCVNLKKLEQKHVSTE